MAHVIIRSNDGRTEIEVRQVVERGEVVINDYEVDEGWAVGYCKPCDEWLTDRGNFEDTCEEIARHLDGHADRRQPVTVDAAIAELEAMEERDRLAGGPPWEVADHPDHDLPGGWHRGQIR